MPSVEYLGQGYGPNRRPRKPFCLFFVFIEVHILRGKPMKPIKTMKALMAAIGIVVGLPCAPTAALAQSNTDFGKEEFESKCASCHGLSGKGDGPLSLILMTKSTDLTTLTKRNGGVFPAQKVYEIIDGRQEVAAHGPRAMPVWGRDYHAKAPDLEAHIDLRTPITQTKILALVDYLYRIQDKK